MTAMIIMNIIARVVCLLVAVAFCGASVSKETKTFDLKIVYGVLSAACIVIALCMGVE